MTDLMIDVIPPKSCIELLKLWPHARKKGYAKGQRWQVGYYSKQDGLGVIWLVDQQGRYNWTIDKEFLKKHFRVIRLSEECDYYGVNKPPLKGS